jgi:mono/diheme cytochrome c family protein
MRIVAASFAAAVVLFLVGVAALFAYAASTGLSARATPSALEARLGRFVRGFAVPAEVRARANPRPASPEMLEGALAHFAEHCASCHGNDGSGDTDLGRGLFPRPPDMRLPATQELADGELFYVIEHGVRFTGMPAFATGDASGEDESWALVHFIRRLPGLSEDERARMEEMNPAPPAEVRQRMEEDAFLSGREP